MFFQKLTVLLLVFGFYKVRGQDFSYDGSLGPNHWGEQYNTCDGKHQSPINIDVLNVRKVTFPPLNFTGFNTPAYTADLQNNGHTVLVTLNFMTPAPTISGGPLNDTFGLAQFHFHWGENDTFGSEDLINNRSFPVELHMVFFNQKYQKDGNSLQYPDGIVVLAFFYELAAESNPLYDEITSLVGTIIEPGTHAMFLKPPKIMDLISNDLTQYFTYSGSLTTPPCSEVVTWLDFAVPIPISSEQIRNFRNIHTHSNQKLTHNFRPIQPLNGRIVYHNDPKHETSTTPRPIPIYDDYDIYNNDLSIIKTNNQTIIKIITETPSSPPTVPATITDDDIDRLLVKKYEHENPKNNNSSSILNSISQLMRNFMILLTFMMYYY